MNLVPHLSQPASAAGEARGELAAHLRRTGLPTVATSGIVPVAEAL